MPPTKHRLCKLACTLALAVILTAPSGCALNARPTVGGWPTPTVAAPEAPSLALAATSTASPAPPTPTTAPTPTPAPGAAPAATATPLPPVTGIVYGDESGVFWADPASGEALPLLAEPLGDSWALQGQHLALVRGQQVEVVDLATGQATMLASGIIAQLAEAQVIWGDDGNTLLLVGWVEPDPLSDEPRQEVIFRELLFGGQAPAAVAYDGPPAMPLAYDSAARRALLWRPGGDGGAIDVLALDMATGQSDAVASIEALSELTLGPRGALAALGQRTDGYQLVLASLAGDRATDAAPLEPGAYATQLTWSPDGERLAYLLWRGELYAPETEAIGLFVYDLATQTASGPLAATLPLATIAGWAPDGESIIVHSQGSEAQYYVAIDPEGGGERLLPLRGAVTLLGWLLRPNLSPDAPALDAWRGRFAAAAGDAQATADAAASYIAGNPDLSLDERIARLGAYYAATGQGRIEWRVSELGDDLYVLEAPPASIVLAVEGQAQIIGQGEALYDARLTEDLLAVIYGGDFGGAQQWSLALLQEQQGQWQTVWQPIGHGDWVTTDGAVQFTGAGIETLRVEGSSRGLPTEAFVECETCPLRRLSAIWRLEGAAYVRETSLPPDAPTAALHWEMTEPTPYAILHEAIRRLRTGKEIGALATAAAADQLARLELQDDALRLMVAEVTPDAIVFGPAATPDRYRAVMHEGQIISVGPRL